VCHQNPELAKLTLLDLMITPIQVSAEAKLILQSYSILLPERQRMPRYALLLTEMLKNTPSTHPDHSLLQVIERHERSYAGLQKGSNNEATFQEAIQKVRQQTERINDFEKTADNINKVSEVQRKLTGTKKKVSLSLSSRLLN